MMKIIPGLLMLLFVGAAHAVVPTATPNPGANQAIGSSAMQNVQRRGFAANDPRVANTLKGISKQATLEIAAASTNVRVLTAVRTGAKTPGHWAVKIASGVGTYLAFDAGLSWLFNDDGSITYTSVAPDPYSGLGDSSVKAWQARYFSDYISTGWVYGASIKNAVEGLHLHAAAVGADGTGFQTTYCSATQAGRAYTCNVSYTVKSNGAKSNITATVIVAEGLDLQTSCPDGYKTDSSTCFKMNPTQLPGGGTVTGSFGQAQANLPSNASVSHSEIAGIANNYWQKAAVQPGYEGVPYDFANPITAADVQAGLAANPAASARAVDWLSPSPTVNPDTAFDTATNPLSPPSFSPAPNAGGSTLTSPTPSPSPETVPKTQVDLGPDPGIGYPGLEATPTHSEILAPIINLFPTLKGWKMPAHDAVCPTFSFSVPFLSSHTYLIDMHCTLLEEHKRVLYNIAMLCWLVIALRIFLTA